MVLNVQHDCERGACSREPLVAQVQERQTTSRTIETIKHSTDGHYIVNMHVLHNPHILRKLFDRESYSIPAIGDRALLHKKYATENRKRLAEKAKGKSSGKETSRRGINEPPSQSSELKQSILILSILICVIYQAPQAQRAQILHQLLVISPVRVLCRIITLYTLINLLFFCANIHRRPPFSFAYVPH